MQEGTIGRRYARALAQALEGSSDEKLTRIDAQLTSVAELLDRRTGMPEFRHAMLNPGFSGEERKAVLEAIAKRHAFDGGTISLLLLLVDKSRVRQLPSIARAFRDEVDTKVGRVRATVITARELDPAALLEIVRAVEKRTGKKVLPEVEVDPTVLSGVRVKIGGLVYDATIRSQLERLKGEFAVQ